MTNHGRLIMLVDANQLLFAPRIVYRGKLVKWEKPAADCSDRRKSSTNFQTLNVMVCRL